MPTVPSASGSRSACPASHRTRGSARFRPALRIAVDGSTATTSTLNQPASSPAHCPVPAPRSSTGRVGSTCVASASRQASRRSDG